MAWRRTYVSSIIHAHSLPGPRHGRQFPLIINQQRVRCQRASIGTGLEGLDIRHSSGIVDALANLFGLRSLLGPLETSPSPLDGMTKVRPNTPSSNALHTLQQMLGLKSDETLEPQSKDAVFVCIDCEAFEHAQHKVTEVGVAVLDTRDTADLSISSSQEAWLSKLRYAHYRPVQYARLVNKRFIKGCPESFNFGVTSWIHLKDTSRVLERLFHDPPRIDVAADFDLEVERAHRNIIFVAHNASADKAYLETVGFSVNKVEGFVRTMDTQVLCGGSKKHSVALRRLLRSLDVKAVNLHNAGNDAAYTLQALLLMALKDIVTPGSVPLDLQKHAGKLPKDSYDNRKAPEVWQGTATRDAPQQETLVAGHPQSLKRQRDDLVSAENWPSRRQRKEASRNGPRVEGAVQAHKATSIHGAEREIVPTAAAPP